MQPIVTRPVMCYHTLHFKNKSMGHRVLLLLERAKLDNGQATVVRLCRVAGKYWMHLGEGETIAVTEEIMGQRKWAKEWPTAAVELDIKINEFVKVAASNHFLLIPGDLTKEVSCFCREAGIRTLRIDTSVGIQ